MNEVVVGKLIVFCMEFGGEIWLYFLNIILDVVIICVMIVDECGNFIYEYEGVYFGGLE